MRSPRTLSYPAFKAGPRNAEFQQAFETVRQGYEQLRGDLIKPEMDDFITKGPWIDVRAYGAKGDGVTNDTQAIQNALNAAATTTGIVYFPSGIYIITDGLTWPEGVSLIGIDTPSYPPSTRVGQWFAKKGTVIYFTENDADNSSFLTANWTSSYTGSFVRVDNIEFIAHNDCNGARHGLDITTNALRNFCVRRCLFTQINGYALKIQSGDNSYLGSQVTLEDCWIWGCAGAVSIFDNDQDYIVWGFNARNVTWSGGSTYDPEDYIWDLRSCDPITIQDIITEGYGPDRAGFTEFTPLAIAPHNQITIDGWHSEWNEGKPTKDIYIGRQSTNEDIDDGSGKIVIRRMKSEATNALYIDADNVAIEFDNCYLDPGSSIEDLYTTAAGKTGVTVTVSDLQYDPTPDDLENVYAFEQLFGKFGEPNYIGKVVGTLKSAANTQPKITLPKPFIIFDWDPSKGPLDSYRTSYIAAAVESHCTGPFIASDGDVGRYNYFIGNADKCPTILWSWDFPSAWSDKLSLTLVVQFKPTLVSGSINGAAARVGHVSGVPAGTNTEPIYTEWLEWDDYEHTPAYDWQVGICHICDADNTGQWGMRTTIHPTSGKLNIAISRVIMSIGNEFMYPTGIIDDAQPIKYWGSAAPTSANDTYIAGDIVFDSSPSAGGKIGWVCTAGGSPGTWKAFGAIDA